MRCLITVILTLTVASSAFGGEPAKAPSINERLKADVDAAPLSLRFKGTTADDCKAWQNEFAAKLRSLLGPHAPPAKWQTQIVSIKEFDDYRREELILTAEGHPSLPIYVLVPKGKKGKRPAVLALHGHGAHGHHPIAGRDDLPGVANAIKNNNYDYGRQLVRQGYVVAAPCFTPFGVRLSQTPGKDACADTFIRMQLLGKTLMAENLRDARWGVELLARHPDVDPERIGCVGLSLGGRMTMLTAALEPRIKLCVISGALNAMQERVSKPYGCGAQIIPGLLKYGDVPEIASLIAPRPCLWEVGNSDKLIDPLWANDILLRQRRAYMALGAEGEVSVDRFEGGHVWHGVAADKLLAKVLRP
ncbi:MAG TPA: alpha/beta hydrolase family protein [Gemmataceae bacterium]|nr:alpha/beta hydrolase family protein [Gemmataceae bacterium]